MPTLVERVATLETLCIDLSRRYAELHDDIHGGTTVAWKQSIRGRLHEMSAAIEAADKLADATRELVREQARTRQSRIKTWQWVIGAVVAIAAVANPYIILIVH